MKSSAWFRGGCPNANLRARISAFTLIELLVVVAIVAILAGLLLPALGAAKARARTTRCVASFQQFAVALQLYAQDHDDALPPNADGRDAPPEARWVQGWLGLPGPDGTNTLFLRQSLLAPYVGGEVKIWQCPAARAVTVGGITQPRVRTVSLNGFLGSPVASPAAQTYRRLGGLPRPAMTFTFLDEREQTINDGSFALQWDFDPVVPAAWVLRDKPGTRHRDGAVLAFADGHLETPRWRDARTLAPPRDDAPSPGNADLQWLQERATERPGLAP
jgi:prepilin-type N-terminal cleavage/methylation domain-containing protein/prepilin-type processing-associated H-X9-DG protein